MIMMIIIALAVGALALFYVAARSRGKQSTSFKPVDLRALRTLMDRDDELFLQEMLPGRCFRRLKRQRIHLTMRYVGRVAANASRVMRLSEPARLAGEPEIAAVAVEITEIATQIRLQCVVAFAKLGAEYALPSLQLTHAALAPRYQALRESFLRLGALETENVAPLATAI